MGKQLSWKHEDRSDRARNIELIAEAKEKDQKAIRLYLEMLTERDQCLWARRQLSGNPRLVDAAEKVEALGGDPVKILREAALIAQSEADRIIE